MDETKFFAALENFSNEFSGSYSQNKIKIMYSSIGYLESGELNHTLTELVKTEKYLPAPATVIELARCKYPPSERNLGPEEECPKCDNSGLILTWRKMAPWEEISFRCNCAHSLTAPQNIPRYDSYQSKRYVKFEDRRPTNRDIEKARALQDVIRLYQLEYKFLQNLKNTASINYKRMAALFPKLADDDTSFITEMKKIKEESRERKQVDFSF